MHVPNWQALESAVRVELANAQETRPLVYHRFLDTKAAGNMVSPQPADFIACFRGNSTLIEVKFSQAHESLKSCFSGSVRAGQLASARIWVRAGAKYVFLFYSKLGGIVEIWDGIYAAECRSKGVPLALEQRRLYGSVEQAVQREVGYS